ncbi:hypothetical protein GCM10025777_07840 [Membranihabitans marinus]
MFLVLSLMTLFIQMPIGNAADRSHTDDVLLAEALQTLSVNYKVFFSYDEASIANVKVDFNPENYSGVEEAMQSILVGTSFQYKIFDQRYVILYEETDRGIQSLKGMVKHLNNVIDVQEKKSGKTVVSKLPKNEFNRGIRKLSEPVLNISGTVTDRSGEPLIGVNVLVKGTTKGTSTDFDGNFNIADVDENAVLIISYIGFVSQEVPVSGKGSFTIVLAEDSQTLDEIVVTALGIERDKRSLGYSVAEVNSEDLEKVPQENALSALNGRVAGVKISSSNNDINSETRVQIRGNTSLTGNDDPLVIIDGVPVGDPTIMNDINPADIASVSVLKGPSAAALYGSRAGNGVLLITTKSGKSTQKGLGVTVNTALTLNQPYSYIPLQNRFTSGRQGIFDEGAYQHWYGPEEGESAVQFGSNGESTPLVFHPDNLENFFQTGVSNINDMSINGSYDKGSFRLSMSYLNATGTTPETELERLGMNLSAKYNLAPNLSVSTNVNFSNSFSDNYPVQVHNDYQFTELYMVPPHVDMNALKDYWLVEDELQNNVNTSFNNPWFRVNEKIQKFDRNRGFGNIKLDWEIIPKLNFMAKISQISGNEKNEELNPWSLYGRVASPRGGYFQDTEYDKEINTDFLFSYNTKLGDFYIAPSVGGNLMRQKRSLVSVGGDNLVLPALYTLSNVERGGLNYQTGVYNKAIYSVYGMATIGYKDMVYLDLTARNDWSSTLPIENRSYFYPSASLSLVLNEFIEMPEWMGVTKLRTGWAEVGKDTDPYAIQARLNQGSYGDLVYYTNPSSMVNANLKPEIATSFEVGLDMAFLDNRLGLDATYYTVQNRNQILSVGIPGMTGFNSTTINAGIVENSGWEVGLFATPVKKDDFQWNVNLNISRQESKLTELTEGVDQIQFWSNVGIQAITRVGETLGDLYGRQTIKVEEGEYAGWNLLDANGELQRSNDYTKVGNYLHKFLLGGQTSISYKNISVSASFDWRNGGDFYSMTMLRLARSGKVEKWGKGEGESTFTGILSALDFNGDRDAIAAEVKSNQEKYNHLYVGGRTADLGGFPYNGRDNGVFFPGVYVNAEGEYVENFGAEGTQFVNSFEIIEPGGGYWDVGHADKFIYDASYVKLRELAISYQLPTSVAQLIGSRGASVSVFTKNLIIWTAAGIGIDPELAFLRTSSSVLQGVDRWNGGPWTSPIGIKLSVDF